MRFQGQIESLGAIKRVGSGRVLSFSLEYGSTWFGPVKKDGQYLLVGHRLSTDNKIPDGCLSLIHAQSLVFPTHSLQVRQFLCVAWGLRISLALKNNLLTKWTH